MIDVMVSRLRSSLPDLSLVALYERLYDLPLTIARRWSTETSRHCISPRRVGI